MKFKLLVLISIVFIFSSCMMMGPANLSNGKNASEMGNYSASTDIVCGHTIDASREALSYQYKDKTYYFDSEKCMNEFKQALENYIHNQANRHHRAGNGMMWGLGGIAMAAMMVAMFL